MTIFVAVAETSSFSEASRKLGLSLATVSRKVAELEFHLKTRVIERSTRALALTEAGYKYLSACRHILEQVAEAERAAAGEFNAPKGDLVISAPSCFGRSHVAPVVRDFLKDYDEIAVRLVLSDHNVRLIDEHVDLAIRFGSFPDSAMRTTRIGAARRLVCGSPSYFAEHGEPASPAELARFACITVDNLDSSKGWSFRSQIANEERAAPVKSRLSVNSSDAALEAALAGLGVARLPSYHAAAPIADGRLKVVLAEFEPEPLPINLVYSGHGMAPFKIRCFIEYVTPRIRKSLVAA